MHRVGKETSVGRDVCQPLVHLRLSWLLALKIPLGKASLCSIRAAFFAPGGGLIFPLLPLSQAHSGAPTVLVDELDASGFERLLKGHDRGLVRGHKAAGHEILSRDT